MDRIDKFINNRSPKKIIMIFFVMLTFSAVLSCFLSAKLADCVAKEQLDVLISSVDIEKCSRYGMRPDMPLKILPIWHKTKSTAFIILFSAMGFCSLLWVFFSIHEIFGIYDKLENLSRDCINSADKLEKSIKLQGADGECVRRISEGAEYLESRMNYLNKCLLNEKNYLKEFLSTFSHQIKTSLAVIQLNTDMLGGNVSPEHREELSEEIQMNLDSMENLVVQAIKLARLETETVGYNMQKMSLADTCWIAIKRVQPLMRNKNIRIDEDFQNDAIFLHDKGWLCEAIENILKNSADHSECSVIEMKTEENYAMVKLFINDNGKGIPQKDIPHIFEPFSKKSVDITMKSSGLGMSIAQKIIRNHGGEIIVYSKIGEGTRFEIVFVKS